MSIIIGNSLLAEKLKKVEMISVNLKAESDYYQTQLSYFSISDLIKSLMEINLN
jgi:hypothetical protein